LNEQTVPRYSVVIEGAELVWPPVEFDDFKEAYAHAIMIAKSWEGLNGSPEIRVRGIEGYDPVWTVDELLSLEKFLHLARFRK
jgi:hypothetical protein